MKNKNTYIIIFTVMVILIIAGVSVLSLTAQPMTLYETGDRLVEPSSNKKRMIVTGRDIYRLNCVACHGTDRSGYTTVYPSLLNLQERLSRETVLKQINHGKGLMPAFPHLTSAEIEALLAFLFEEQADAVEISVENMGIRIFRSNCAVCHRATVNDPVPPNVHMMEPAPLAGATKRFTRQEFFTIMETGICYMPSFDHFTSQEREAIYSYAKSLEGQGEPPRPTMGEMCPMMMRMR